MWSLCWEALWCQASHITSMPFLFPSDLAATHRPTPLTPTLALHTCVLYGYGFAFFQQVKHLSAHSLDLQAPAWLQRCPLLLPHGSALGELSCLHPMRMLWRKTSSRCHVLAFCSSTWFIRGIPLRYSTVRSNQPFSQVGQETEKQHIFHLNLKEETKCNRINAKSMCLICHRSSAWCFDRALDFKKHPQRSVCIQGFWLSLQIYLYKAARAGAMPCVLGLNVDKWLDGYFSNLGCLLHSAQCQQTPSGKVMLF